MNSNLKSTKNLEAFFDQFYEFTKLNLLFSGQVKFEIYDISIFISS